MFEGTKPIGYVNLKEDIIDGLLWSWEILIIQTKNNA